MGPFSWLLNRISTLGNIALIRCAWYLTIYLLMAVKCQVILRKARRKFSNIMWLKSGVGSLNRTVRVPKSNNSKQKQIRNH